MSLLATVEEGARGARGLLRRPRGLPGVVISLAIGVGAVAGAWTVLQGVLLAPLPFPESDRLISFWDSSPAHGRTGAAEITDVQFKALRHGRPADNPIAVYEVISSRVRLPGQEDPQQCVGMVVSGEYFDVLGVRPAKGRTLSRWDEALQAAPVVVISSALASTRFGETPVGQLLPLDGVNYRIVGVMPSWFRPVDASIDYWIPIVFTPNVISTGSDEPRISTRVRRYRAIGRLDRSESPTGFASWANGELGIEASATGGITAEDLHDSRTRHARFALSALQAAAILVLVLACTNAAWLLGWRARASGKRLAIMAVLGGSPRRVLAMQSGEVLAIAAAVGILGTAASWALVRIVVSLGRGALPRLAEIRFDLGTAATCASLAIGATIVSALPMLAGAVRVARRDSLVRMTGRGGRRTSMRSQAAMALQVGIVFALCLQAAVLLLVLRQLVGGYVGFDRIDVVTARVTIPEDVASDPSIVAAHYQDIVARLAANGIEAAVTSSLPLSGRDSRMSVRMDPDRRPFRMTGFRTVTPSYFESLGLRLLDGRFLVAADAGEQHVVINQTLARQLYGGDDAVGESLVVGAVWSPSSRVVGVVEDVRYWGLLTEPGPELYMLQQDAARFATVDQSTAYLVIEPAPDVVGSVAEMVSQVAPGADVSQVRPFRDMLWSASDERPLLTGAFLALAIVALVLMAVGLRGLLSQELAAREPAMAVRVALGAPRHRLVAACFGDTAKICSAGLLAGAIFYATAARIARSIVAVPPGMEVPGPGLLGIAVGIGITAVIAGVAFRPVYRLLGVDATALLADGR